MLLNPESIDIHGMQDTEASLSFLPEPYAPTYGIDPKYARGTVYLCSEFAIDQSFKIYSGGLGFLAGSHMRSAAALKQNLCGIGILWTCGYYNQTRGEGREMAVQFRRKEYAFLQDTGIRMQIPIFGHQVTVGAKFLPSEIFGAVPMFFLTTDLDENPVEDRQITQRLYDNDPSRRIAQYIVLGSGGASLMDALDVEPEVWHLNEAHGLSAAFHMLAKCGGDAEKVRQRFVFTTHTPEEAGNEKHDFSLLQRASFFGNLSEEQVRSACGIHDSIFNHSLAAMRLSRIANGVSKLHGEVSREMWSHHENICPITHITNAQNARFWRDRGLQRACEDHDPEFLHNRKRELKDQLFRVVADQTGKLFDPDTLTLVWARRFAGYKRAELITHDVAKFRQLVQSSDRPIQIIWAGKPYPFDYASIDNFNHLVRFSQDFPNVAVLVGYELELSRMLKCGADIWLNNPVVTREASGTSGMTAAMNAAVNLSTYDGWICEFARDEHNAFIVSPADPELPATERDEYDRLAIIEILEKKALPMYYQQPDKWSELIMNSMNDVVPFFDSDRMADEYYAKIYTEA